MEPVKFLFGSYVFELNSRAILKDDKDDNSNVCLIHMRGSKEAGANPKKNRFLMGNVFLKNFYSVYDYDD